jgi:hypothetical protein
MCAGFFYFQRRKTKMPRRAAQRKPETQAAELPEVLVAPSAAADKDREAYWINLLANVDELKAATETTDFFVLCQEFPPAAWDRLTIYLYRLTDDAGMLIKNSDDKPHYIKVLRQPLTEEFVMKNWGGGKYQALLKIDNKEVLRKHTFRIDGDPKVLPGQRVEVEGRVVPLSGAAPAPVAPATDLATAVDASRHATESAMSVLTDAAKTSIKMVQDQAATNNTSKNENPLTTIEGIAAIAKMFQPPPAPDPIDTFIKLQTLMHPAPVEKEEKDTPIEETLGAIEKLTGGRSLVDLLKPAAKAAAEENPWAPFAGVAQSFVASLPSLMAEFRQTRLIEMRNRDLQWRRDLWARTAKQGEQPPPDLMGEQVALPPAPPARPQPVNAPAAPSAADPNALISAVVGLICQGFDNSPYMGEQTAGAIDLLYGRALEHLGVTAILANEAELDKYIAGVPALAQRSQFATWKTFKGDFLRYTVERWAEEPADDDEKAAGPQPVA